MGISGPVQEELDMIAIITFEFPSIISTLCAPSHIFMCHFRVDIPQIYFELAYL